MVENTKATDLHRLATIRLVLEAKTMNSDTRGNQITGGVRQDPESRKTITELDELLGLVGRLGFLTYAFRSDRDGPEVLALVCYWEGGTADVVIILMKSGLRLSVRPVQVPMCSRRIWCRGRMSQSRSGRCVH